MEQLKNLVLYREHFYEDRPLNKPSIEDYKGLLPVKLADDIIKYLESGYRLLEFVSPIEDPYNPEDKVPFVIFTDGVYVWDEVIISWLKKYRVQLPREFLEYFDKINKKTVDHDSIPIGLSGLLKEAEEIFV